MLYEILIRLTFETETEIIMKVNERRLLTFQRKILRKMYYYRKASVKDTLYKQTSSLRDSCAPSVVSVAHVKCVGVQFNDVKNKIKLY